MVVLAILTFAVLVFYAEKDAETIQGDGWTLIDSLWWGVMTLTTVGYDLKSPKTALGKCTKVHLILRVNHTFGVGPLASDNHIVMQCEVIKVLPEKII